MNRPTLIIGAALASAVLGAGASIAAASNQAENEAGGETGNETAEEAALPESEAPQETGQDKKIEKIGEPINCIHARHIRSTNVVDNQTIDFKMLGGKIYRNSMARKCPGLKMEKAFSYRSSANKLCNVDIIRVLQNYGGSLREGAGCGLGKFQEIKKIK